MVILIMIRKDMKMPKKKKKKKETVEDNNC